MNDMPTTPPEPLASLPPAPADGAGRRLPPVVAPLALAILAAVVTVQMIGEPLAALGALIGCAAAVFAVWRRLVLRAATVSLGGAAAAGALGTLGAYFGAAILGGGLGRIVTDTDAMVAVLFSFWLALPILIAAAVALAVLTRTLARGGR